MRTRIDPLEYLEREDKWFLGGGRAAMFAPPFPRWLDAFGFWDEAYYADVRLHRLFTALILDEHGRPVRLRRESRRWTPDALTQTHTSPDGLRIREDRVVTEHDTLASRIAVYNEGKRARSLHLILWSLQEQAPMTPGVRAATAENPARAGEFLTFTHAVEYGENPYSDRPAENQGWGERPPHAESAGPHRLHVALGADRAPVSWAMQRAERADDAPHWQVSPAAELFRNGLLQQPSQLSTLDSRLPDSHLHLCLHYTLDVPSGESRTIQFGAALSLDRDLALLYLQNDLQRDVAAASRESWRAYFQTVPYFECSDPWLQRAWWYRWYGIRLLTVRLPASEGGEEPPPCVYEGIGGFRSHISYSAQCHMMETGWMRDPALAFGCLEGMLAAQENSGFIPGHLYLWREGRGFYHANWGANALDLYHRTGDRDFVERIYPGLSRYADYFERDRDREDMHLYDVADMGETGQEYMSRYLFADESADDWRRIQLKGVDATVYIYGLQRSLAQMARLLDKHPEAEVWDRKADATRSAVLERMWDPERRFFFDVDPRTGERSPYLAATGFYPFLTDIAAAEHVQALKEHLLNPAEFWTAYPVPASPLNDPYFSAEGEWKGRRMSCPWNGRSWPMATSHVCDALARAAQSLAQELKPQAAELILRFVRTLFWNGDPQRPNCFEHYNPLTGAPSAYRGIDDYQHSYLVDLLVKYLAGIQPGPGDALVIDPLPFAIERFALEGVPVRGHRIDVNWDSQSGMTVNVDGEPRATMPERARIELEVTGGAT